MKRFVAGVTLIELLSVILSLSILVGITIGSWFYYRLKVKRDGVMEQVRHAMAMARSEAMLRQAVVVYCSSADLKHCGGRWDQGQIIRYRHSNRVLRTYPPVPGVLSSFHANFGRNDRILFSAEGFTEGQNGRFDFCVESKFAFKPCRSLILHFSGQTVG